MERGGRGRSRGKACRGNNHVSVHRCSCRVRGDLCARAGTFANGLDWRCRLRAPVSFCFTQLDPLLSSWMSSPSHCFQDFPVLMNLASEQPTAPSFTQPSGNSIGGSVLANHVPTTASKYSNTDLPCCTQVAITVQIRSHQRFPLSLRVPCVINRSITTNRIACSARLLVGSTPGVVMNRK